MNLKQENRHIVDILFVLALFGVFAISALMLILIGANVYQKTVDDMSHNFDSRTAFSYVTEKIRQNDDANQVSIGTFENTPAIILSEKTEDGTYCTYLYQYNDSLMELFAKKDANLGSNPLAAGQPVLDIKDFQLEEVNSQLYHFYLQTKDEKTLSLYISLHSDQS